MNLCFEQIEEIVTGAVRIGEENSSVRLYRFTKEQEELYRVTNRDFYTKTMATAGIKLLFKTNSKGSGLKVSTAPGSSRKYFSVDIFVHGEEKYIANLRLYPNDEVFEYYFESLYNKIWSEIK